MTCAIKINDPRTTNRNSLLSSSRIRPPPETEPISVIPRKDVKVKNVWKLMNLQWLYPTPEIIIREYRIFVRIE